MKKNEILCFWLIVLMFLSVAFRKLCDCYVYGRLRSILDTGSVIYYFVAILMIVWVIAEEVFYEDDD